MMNEIVENSALKKTRAVHGANLLEMMEICSNMYLTHLLAVEILGADSDDFSELGESSLIIAILSIDAPVFFKRLNQIH